MNRRVADRMFPGLLAFLILALAPAAGADVLYVASNRVVVMDSDTGVRLAEIPLERFVHDIAFTPDGRRAYLAVSDGVVEVDATTHAVLDRLTTDPAFKLRVSDDGRQLYVLGNELRELESGTREVLPSTITVVDVTTQSVIQSLPVGMRAEEFVLASGGLHIVRPLDYAMDQITATDGATVRSLTLRHQAEEDPRPGFLHGLAMAPDGRRVVVAQAGTEIVLHAVDTVTGSRETLPFAHQGFVTGVAFAPDGNTLYVSTRNHLAILDAESGSERAWIALGDAHHAMAVSNDGDRTFHTVAVVDERGGAVTVVDTAAGRVARVLPVEGISPAAIAVQPGT